MKNVSKKFSNNLKKSMIYGLKDISRNLLRFSTKSYKLRKTEFWAVDNVSFQVNKGECLGIIGPNGSGKSTILKMLNGIYWPDKGMISINGKVGALIEVGAGFHPMLTGKENIYLNAAILGMSKRETDEKFDEIVKFADIGNFIDSPVKFYSSGMYVRLGFSVAAHCDTDILLVDEILAVGDTSFRRKSSERMKQFILNEEKSIVFVSHNMQSIESIADKALLLDKGKVVAFGEVSDVVAEYELLMRPYNESNAKVYSNPKVKSDELKLIGKYLGFADDSIIIQRVWLETSDGVHHKQFTRDENVSVCVAYSRRSDTPIKNGFVSVSFINEFGINCMGARLKLGEQGIPEILPESGILRVNFRPLQLTTSSYKLSIAFFDHTYTTPYAQGHYGHIKVINNIPTHTPGDNTPVCWPSCKWNLDKPLIIK